MGNRIKAAVGVLVLGLVLALGAVTAMPRFGAGDVAENDRSQVVGAARSNQQQRLGTGHPNKLLYVDYAGLERGKWFVRVETQVPIDTQDLPRIQRLLASDEPTDTKALINYLVGKVPISELPVADRTRERENAKHMIAAAFGAEYPAGGPVTDRPPRPKR